VKIKSLVQQRQKFGHADDKKCAGYRVCVLFHIDREIERRDCDAIPVQVVTSCACKFIAKHKKLIRQIAIFFFLVVSQILQPGGSFRFGSYLNKCHV